MLGDLKRMKWTDVQFDCKDFSLVICHDSSSALLFVCLFLLQIFKNKNFMRLLAEDAEVFCHVGG